LLWEHQADCGAGVWLRFAQDHHMVSAKEDPIGGVVRFFDDLNKEKHRTTDPTHGMPNERRQLFLRGYNSPNGLMGCNDIHDSMGHSLASRPIVPPPTVPSTTPKALGPLKSELTLAA
jgi:predicted metalloprotease